MYYIIYLFVLSSVLFINRDWRVLSGLLTLQLVLWIVCRVPVRAFPTMLRRIWLFLVLVLISYAFVSAGVDVDHWINYEVGSFSLSVNLSGVMLALLMCERILCLLMASTWVQHAATPEQFVAGLTRFGVPESVAIALRHAMVLVAGGRGEGRKRGKGRSNSDKPRPQLRRILKGDITPVRKLMDWAFERADKRLEQHEPELSSSIRSEISVMLSMTLAMMSFKMIVLVPGIMIAPGHKNVILIPLFLIAAQRTQSRFGGMWTGLCMGLVNFMMGFGKLGILELVQFMFTGLLADVLLPMYRAHGRVGGILQLAVVGAMMGLARFSTNILLLLLAGAPAVGFAILAPILGAQIFFGALSAFPARVLLKDPASPR